MDSSNTRLNQGRIKTRPINSFGHPVADYVIKPGDQPMLDRYVAQHGISATSIRPKRNNLHTVTMADRRKLLARVLGKRELEYQSATNLIKVVNRKRAVRYYLPTTDHDDA